MNEFLREFDVLEALRKYGPLTAPQLVGEKDIPKTYRQIAQYEKTKQLKVGFKRKGNKGILFCFLPEHDDDIKKENMALFFFR